jgi:gas vesicle protein
VGQAPDDIRQDIEQTRERMSEKADALAYKTDVPARTRDRVDDAKESVMSKVHEVTDRVTGKAHEVTGKAHEAKDRVSGTAGHGTEEARDRVRRVGGLAQDNPLGLAVGAAALGFLAGLLIPTTRAEHERLGAAGEQVRGKARELGQEAMDRGRQVAETTKEAAKESVKGQASEARGEHVRTEGDSTDDRPAQAYATP